MEFTAACPCMLNAVKICAKIFNFQITCTKAECCCTIPTLKDGSFTVQYMPSVIRYLGRKAQCSCYANRDLQQKTQVDRFLDAAQALASQVMKYNCLCNNGECYTDALAKVYYQKLNDMLYDLDAYLANNTYLVNERISLADIMMMPILAVIFSKYVAERNVKVANVIRYAKTIVATLNVEDIIGELEFAKGYKVHCEVEQAKKEEPKKAEPKKTEAKKEATEEAAPAAEAAKKGPKYQYTTNLDAWKRYYKNLDWEGGADWQEYFWKTAFNPKEFSLWFIDYKDPEDFKEDWKTKNLVSILCQRLEGCKANANSFANIVVVKKPTEEHFNIVGVVMSPGQTEMEEWADCSGTQSFNWTKIDDFDKDDVKLCIKRIFDWDEKNPIVFHGKDFGSVADGNGVTFV